jgi:NADH dehydrogenase
MARNVRRSAQVVVLGAGFAGASLLRHLSPVLRRPGKTLLIDRREEYTFVPLIHEVAVGRVHPRTVSSPIAPLCAGVCEFLHSEVSGIDLAKKTLETSEGPVGYEYLVLNPGSVAAEPGPRLRD